MVRHRGPQGYMPQTTGSRDETTELHVDVLKAKGGDVAEPPRGDSSRRWHVREVMPYGDEVVIVWQRDVIRSIG